MRAADSVGFAAHRLAWRNINSYIDIVIVIITLMHKASADCHCVLQTGYFPQLVPDTNNITGAAFSKIDG